MTFNVNETPSHNLDVIMGVMASQITGVAMDYSTVCSGADQRKHQSSASLVFVRGIHQWPVNSPCKGPVTRKMFPFDDVITACTSYSVGVLQIIAILSLAFNPCWLPSISYPISILEDHRGLVGVMSHYHSFGAINTRSTRLFVCRDPVSRVDIHILMIVKKTLIFCVSTET